MFWGILVACETNPSPFPQFSQGTGQGGEVNPGNSTGGQEPGNPYNPGGTSQRVPDFPYELTPDTISALTCHQTQYIGGRLPFTLSVGAYWKDGLQFSEDFLRNNGITRVTPPQQIRQLLEQSPFKMARARMALQNEGNLQSVIRYQSFFPIFHNPSTLDNLSQKGFAFTARSLSATQANGGANFGTWLPIEGSYLINTLVPGFPKNTPGTPLLTLTYTLGENRSILSLNGQPYGKGYKLQFHNIYKADYLRDVHEEDLATTQRTGSWICPEELRFMVHRSLGMTDSIFNQAYPNFSFPSGVLPEGYCAINEIEITEKQEHFFHMVFGERLSNLPFHFGTTMIINANDRRQNTFHPCIKFERDSCYIRSNRLYRIEFDPDKLNDCKFIYNVTSNGDYYKICPAFLSICYKTQ